MSKDSQIEEMANDLENHTCMSQYQAEIASRMLYAKGYRKASEVAEEIFAEIDKQIAFFRMYMFLNKGVKAIVNTLDELKKNTRRKGNDTQ